MDTHCEILCYRCKCQRGVFQRAWYITVSSRPSACHAQVLRDLTVPARQETGHSEVATGQVAGVEPHFTVTRRGEAQDWPHVAPRQSREDVPRPQQRPSLAAGLTTPVTWKSRCAECTCSPPLWELNSRDCTTGGQTGANSSSSWEDTSATAVEASTASEEHADGRWHGGRAEPLAAGPEHTDTCSIFSRLERQ